MKVFTVNTLLLNRLTSLKTRNDDAEIKTEARLLWQHNDWKALISLNDKLLEISNNERRNFAKTDSLLSPEKLSTLSDIYAGMSKFTTDRNCRVEKGITNFFIQYNHQQSVYRKTETQYSVALLLNSPKNFFHTLNEVA